MQARSIRQNQIAKTRLELSTILTNATIFVLVGIAHILQMGIDIRDGIRNPTDFISDVYAHL